jgi:hypothetical protein
MAWFTSGLLPTSAQNRSRKPFRGNGSNLKRPRVLLTASQHCHRAGGNPEVGGEADHHSGIRPTPGGRADHPPGIAYERADTHPQSAKRWGCEAHHICSPDFAWSLESSSARTYEVALALVCRAGFCNRYCQTNLVNLEGSRSQVWPNNRVK